MHTFNFSVWRKNMQFVYTVSSFLHIMIRHNVDFCKNEPRFMPLIIFHLNCILLLMMKMNKKQFLFHSWKIRAEGRSPLIRIVTIKYLMYINVRPLVHPSSCHFLPGSEFYWINFAHFVSINILRSFSSIYHYQNA